MSTKKTDYIGLTKKWVERLVIGLNLCPFAKKPFLQGQIRYAVEESDDPKQLMHTFLQELLYLASTAAEQTETTLLIHPNCLINFYDYLDFVAEAEAAIETSELTGVMQVASFHPDYQFAGTQPTDAENFTNRSPFPMLHLIREESIEKALEHYPDPEEIPKRNIETMNRLGTTGIQKILNQKP